MAWSNLPKKVPYTLLSSTHLRKDTQESDLALFFGRLKTNWYSEIKPPLENITSQQTKVEFHFIRIFTMYVQFIHIRLSGLNGLSYSQLLQQALPERIKVSDDKGATLFLLHEKLWGNSCSFLWFFEGFYGRFCFMKGSDSCGQQFPTPSIGSCAKNQSQWRQKEGLSAK